MKYMLVLKRDKWLRSAYESLSKHRTISLRVVWLYAVPIIEDPWSHLQLIEKCSRAASYFGKFSEEMPIRHYQLFYLDLILLRNFKILFDTILNLKPLHVILLIDVMSLLTAYTFLLWVSQIRNYKYQIFL